MNCNRFRFLIQQSFDMELSPQDEQLVSAHLDSCQSCSRFQHQIDQVVQAAVELPIPEEAAPTNLESLARMIMQQLPQQKGNFLSAISGLFGGGGGKAKEPKPQKQKAAPVEDRDSGGSRFPHVRRKKPTEEVEKPAKVGKQKTRESTDQEVTAARLRSISRKSDGVDPQSQSGVRSSLGEKFGMVAPPEQVAEETPMTLAQSIRRRVTEQVTGDKIDEAKEEAQAVTDSGEEGWGGMPPAQGEEPAWGQSSSGSRFPASPGAQPGGFGQQPPPQPEPWNQPPAQGGGWGEQQSQSDGWGQSPAPGVFAQQQQQQQSGSNWGQAQPPSPGGQPPQPDSWGQAQPQGGGWGEPQQQSWGQSSRSDDWGQSDSSASGNLWGQPAGGGGQKAESEWSSSSQGGSWGGGASPGPATPAQSGDGWGSSGGWGSPQPPAGGSGSAWGSPQPAAG